MHGPRNVTKPWGVPAAWDMTQAPATCTRRRSTVPSAGSCSPMQTSGHERRWWRPLLHHGLLLRLLHGLLLLLHGQLLLLHDQLLLLHGWLLLLLGRLLLELNAWQRLLVDLLLLFRRHAWRGLLMDLLLLLRHTGRGLLVLLLLQLLRRA